VLYSAVQYSTVRLMLLLTSRDVACEGAPDDEEGVEAPHPRNVGHLLPQPGQLPCVLVRRPEGLPGVHQGHQQSYRAHVFCHVLHIAHETQSDGMFSCTPTRRTPSGTPGAKVRLTEQ